MKKTNISRKRDESNRDELKSLEQWDNERKIIQDEIDHKKLLIEKNIELKNLIQKKRLWLSFINKWNIKNTFNIIKKQDLDDILQTAYLKFLKKPVYYNDDINTQYFKKVLKSVYIDTYRRRKNNKYVSLEKSLKHLDKLFYYNDNRMIDWKGQTTRNKILFSFNGEKYTENTKKQEDRYKNVLLKICFMII